MKVIYKILSRVVVAWRQLAIDSLFSFVFPLTSSVYPSVPYAVLHKKFHCLWFRSQVFPLTTFLRTGSNRSDLLNNLKCLLYTVPREQAKSNCKVVKSLYDLKYRSRSSRQSSQTTLSELHLYLQMMARNTNYDIWNEYWLSFSNPCFYSNQCGLDLDAIAVAFLTVGK